MRLGADPEGTRWGWFQDGGNTPPELAAAAGEQGAAGGNRADVKEQAPPPHPASGHLAGALAGPLAGPLGAAPCRASQGVAGKAHAWSAESQSTAAGRKGRSGAETVA